MYDWLLQNCSFLIYMASDSVVDIGPLHNIRIRRPHIKRNDLRTLYGGYLTLAITLICVSFCVFYPNKLIFFLTNLRAHVGDADAQFTLGQHYLQGHEVMKNTTHGMYWFKRASERGHLHAGYNLGYGHIRRLHFFLKQGAAAKLISDAADAGIEQARYAMKYMCSDGFCDI